MQKRNILHFLILTVLGIFTWHKILGQNFWGDGFYFFPPLMRDFTSPGNVIGGVATLLHNWRYNIAARVIWDIIIPLFRDNTLYYMTFELTVVIVSAFFVYTLAGKLTSTPLLGLIAGVVYLENYGEIYEMIAEGNYNRFLDRMPMLPFSLLGIIFLDRYLKKRKGKFLFISYLLFSVSTYLDHFLTFLLPFYVFYAIIFLFNKKKPIKSLLRGILVSSFFLIVNFVISSHSDQRSGVPFSYLLDPKNQIIEKTFLFGVPMVVPIELVVFLGKHSLGRAIVHPYVSIVSLLAVLLMVVGTITLVYLWKKDKKLFPPYLSCFLSILAGNFMTIYTDPVKYNPLKYFNPGRQLYIQGIFYAIALAITLKIIFFQRRILKTVGIILFLAIFSLYNTKLAWDDINANQYLYEGNKKVFAYIRILAPEFTKDSVIVVAPHINGAATFASLFYTPHDVKFITSPEDIRQILKLDKKNIFVLDLSYGEAYGPTFRADGGKVIDRTLEYREGKLDLLQDGRPGTYFIRKTN